MPPHWLKVPSKGICRTTASAAPEGFAPLLALGAYRPRGVCQALPSTRQEIRTEVFLPYLTIYTASDACCGAKSLCDEQSVSDVMAGSKRIANAISCVRTQCQASSEELTLTNIQGGGLHVGHDRVIMCCSTKEQESNAGASNCVQVLRPTSGHIQTDATRAHRSSRKIMLLMWWNTGRQTKIRYTLTLTSSCRACTPIFCH